MTIFKSEWICRSLDRECSSKSSQPSEVEITINRIRFKARRFYVKSRKRKYIKIAGITAKGATLTQKHGWPFHSKREFDQRRLAINIKKKTQTEWISSFSLRLPSDREYSVDEPVFTTTPKALPFTKTLRAGMRLALFLQNHNFSSV